MGRHGVNHDGTLAFHYDGPIGTLTINRPQQRNALNQEMWVTIREWIEHLPQEVKLLVLQGSQHVFTAGSDIKEFVDLPLDQMNNVFVTMESTIGALEQLAIPSIASIDGPVFGAGLVLALACDLRIGSDLGQFGVPVGRLGITLQPPFLRRLTHVLGFSRTKDLIYTGRTYTAEEALTNGILNYLVPSNHLPQETQRLAERILQQSPASLSAVKENIRLYLTGDLGIEPVGAWIGPDFAERTRSFTKKRHPPF